jgi:hypothetical protein
VDSRQLELERPGAVDRHPARDKAMHDFAKGFCLTDDSPPNAPAEKPPSDHSKPNI